MAWDACTSAYAILGHCVNSEITLYIRAHLVVMTGYVFYCSFNSHCTLHLNEFIIAWRLYKVIGHSGQENNLILPILDIK